MSARATGPYRSEDARQAILDAAVELLAVHGYAGLTMERIAATAKVGKQTIYRWWPSKSAVLAECLISERIPALNVALNNSGDLVHDVAEWLNGTTDETEDRRTLMRGLAAAAAENQVVGDALYEKFTGQQQSALVARIQSAYGVGHVEIDPALAAEAVLGIVLYRLLAGSPTKPITTDELRGLLRPRV